MSNSIGIALYVEFRKAAAARVLWATAILFLVGVTVLAVTLSVSAAAGDQHILAQLGPLAETTGWPLLIGVSAQITAAGGLLAAGIAISWLFGREFTDGTISGLFALPVSRAMLATAKFGAQLGWVVLVACGVAGSLLLAGLVLELGPVTPEVLQHILRLILLTVLTGLLTFPAAWAATLGRGPLPGIAVTVGLLVIAQVTAIAVPQFAVWNPLAVPALWALFPEVIHAGHLGSVAILPVVFVGLTAIAWQRLTQ